MNTRLMEWQKDILGDGFEMTHVDQGRDYAGDVRCTVVRHKADSPARRGVLYVHGFSDYFFQREMALEFTGHDFNFYAVDLRRYGRSLQPGDKMFRVKDMREYFADIQTAVDIMKNDGVDEIILIGHSTGGLTTSLYIMNHPDKAIKGLILNSPFLTWNLPKATIQFGIPFIKLIGRIFPKFPVNGDGTNLYASALAEHLGGEWKYNTEWKPDVMPDVDAEWITAIDNGQRGLKAGKIKVPVLFLHSSKSATLKDSPDAYREADGVLNVRTMALAGQQLGPDIEEVEIPGGLHDLVLSRRKVREMVYSIIFEWLRRFKWQ